MSEKPMLQPRIKLSNVAIDEVSFRCARLEDGYGEMELEVDVDTHFNDAQLHSYIVFIVVKVKSLDGSFDMSVHSKCTFETSEPIDEEFKTSKFVTMSSPAIAFPFVRSFVNTIATNSGHGQLILPAFNFTKNSSTP
jgi:preprotein translocase subunit SecB